MNVRRLQLISHHLAHPTVQALSFLQDRTVGKVSKEPSDGMLKGKLARSGSHLVDKEEEMTVTCVHMS